MSTPALPIDAYYESTTGKYLIQDNRTDWMKVDRESLRHRLALLGYRMRVKKDEALSPADYVVVRIQQERNVSYAGPLAGFERGERTINGVRILITHSPVLIEPRQGDWPLIRVITDNQFAPWSEPAIDQRPYWHAWVQLSLRALRQTLTKGRVTYGQVMMLVGKRGCGKSLLQTLVTHILGGREVFPYHFMAGLTPFNREHFANEHQRIEDEQEHKDLKNRVRFGSALKQIASRVDHPCYGKNRDGQTLTPFWRCTVSANDEPDHLEVLPPFHDSLQDKVILLHCHKLPMPMPAGTPEEKDLFIAALCKELPAYIHWLDNEFVIPPEVADPSRYGVKPFFHPHIMLLLNDLQAETRLLALIDHILFMDGCKEWSGTAEELTRVLFESESYKAQAKSLLSFSGAAGRLLSLLAKACPDRVVEARTALSRDWNIYKAVDTTAATAPTNDGMTADSQVHTPQ